MIQKLSTEAKQHKEDILYMDICARLARESYSRRSKVGCVIVKNNNIISHGWNGTPSGYDNECEDVLDDGTLVTKREVLHAESNAFMKLLSSDHTPSTAGATIYTTLSPCFDCSKLIAQARIARVVYRDLYRIADGLEFLVGRGIEVVHLKMPPPPPSIFDILRERAIKAKEAIAAQIEEHKKSQT